MFLGVVLGCFFVCLFGLVWIGFFESYSCFPLFSEWNNPISPIFLSELNTCSFIRFLEIIKQKL